MAEQQQTPVISEISNKSSRKKLEKLKAKFFELFFPSSQQQQQQNGFDSRRVSKTPSELSSIGSLPEQPLSNSMLITNCYYGYKTHIEDDKENGRSKKAKQKSQNSSNQQQLILITSSTSNSSSSSMFEDLDNCLQQQQQQQYQPSWSTNSGANFESINNFQDSLSAFETSSFNFESIDAKENPFLKKSLTDLISFNSDLDTLNAIFQPYLTLIDGIFYLT